MSAAHRDLWTLDPAITFLNHGSFGACPRAVLAAQQSWRDRLEEEPVRFLVRELEPLLDGARAELARFLDAATDDLVFVPNATAGVNTVLRSLAFEPGDELLTTTHAYNACRNALDYVAERAGARVVVADVPFPLDGAEQVVDAVLACAGPRTRLALLDHVTSPTGVVFPITTLVRALDARGIDTLVDGAHAPGMVPVALDALDAAYYTGNCHKWLCAPKTAGFLRVRRDRRDAVRPLAISHGANSPRAGRSRFHCEFEWTGSLDPSAYLCVPEAIREIGGMLPGGWDEVRARNRALALAARRRLCGALGCALPCPEDMIGALAAVPLPDADVDAPARRLGGDPLQDILFERHAIEVPIFSWPAPPRRLLRISAQLYNDLDDYERLARALGDLIPG